MSTNAKKPKDQSSHEADQTLLDIDNRWAQHRIGLSDMLKCTNVVETSDQITFTVEITLDSCPKCRSDLGENKDRTPTLTDIPLDNKWVKLELRSHYYICNTKGCMSPDVFELTDLASPNSRYTKRLLEQVRRRGMFPPKEVSKWSGLEPSQIRKIRNTAFRSSTTDLPKSLGIMSLRLDSQNRTLLLYDATGSPNDEGYFLQVRGDFYKEAAPAEASLLVEEIRRDWETMYKGEELLLVTQMWYSPAYERITSEVQSKGKNNITFIVDPFHILRYAYAYTFRRLGAIAIAIKNIGAYDPLSTLLTSWTSFFSYHKGEKPSEISNLLSQIGSVLGNDHLDQVYYAMQSALAFCNPEEAKQGSLSKSERTMLNSWEKYVSGMGLAGQLWQRTIDDVREWQRPVKAALNEKRFRRDLTQRWYEYMHSLVYEKNGIKVEENECRTERLKQILSTVWLPDPMTDEQRFRPTFWCRGKEFYATELVHALKQDDLPFEIEFDNFMTLPHLYGIDEDELWESKDRIFFEKS